MSLRLAASLALATLALSVPACSSTPQCVIDTDCPLGQYCTNTPGGGGGSCVELGEHDGGPRTDGGSVDAGAGDGGGDTGPRPDTGPTPDTGASDGGGADTGEADAGAMPDAA